MEARLEQVLQTYNYDDELPILLVGINAKVIDDIFKLMRPKHIVYTTMKINSNDYGKYHILDCQTEYMIELIEIYNNSYLNKENGNRKRII